MPGPCPKPGRGGLAHAPDRAGPAGPCPAPCAGAVGPPSEGPGGGARRGPSERAQHMGRGMGRPARPGPGHGPGRPGPVWGVAY